jgi:DNA-binding CsgD family transcriptional regulator
MHLGESRFESSNDAALLLDAPLRASLDRAARSLCRSGVARREVVLAGLHAQLVCLADPGGDRVMFWLDRLGAPTVDPLSVLAPRVREAVVFLASGATARETANAMQVTENTVRGYLKQAYRVLGVGSRVELAERIRSVRQ